MSETRKAMLIINEPESCGTCDFARQSSDEGIYCIFCPQERFAPYQSRAPFCPLTIVKDEPIQKEKLGFDAPKSCSECGFQFKGRCNSSRRIPFNTLKTKRASFCPIDASINPAENHISAVTDMTLRDYFAGQHLAGAMANTLNESNVEQEAELAYRMADAMLKAREEMPCYANSTN